MCGIIGISSNKPVSSIILNSLKKLEYNWLRLLPRKGFINEIKCEGRVNNLEKSVLSSKLDGVTGIGHVRWATHGLPNTINAHPHSSEKVSVVHNGIIENATLLKKHLVKNGHKFKSQTDTEVIVHLITEYLKTNNIKNTITKVLNKSMVVLLWYNLYRHQTISWSEKGSPLAVGYGPSENYLGSDSIL